MAAGELKDAQDTFWTEIHIGPQLTQISLQAFLQSKRGSGEIWQNLRSAQERDKMTSTAGSMELSECQTQNAFFR